MTSIAALVYGAFLILVGMRGNAAQLVTELGKEGRFVYWILLLFIIAALWETPVGAGVARPLIVLVIVAFLLRNWQTLTANARAALPARQ